MFTNHLITVIILSAEAVAMQKDLAHPFWRAVFHCVSSHKKFIHVDFISSL